MNERYMFRGKRLDNGEWVEGYYMPGDGSKYSLIWHKYDEPNNAWHNIEVNSTTVGQYTGLHDKNGTLIYEGDIFKQNNGVVCVVEWLNDSWNAYYRPLILHMDDGMEIIGNIHDNPELMRVAGNA